MTDRGDLTFQGSVKTYFQTIEVAVAKIAGRSAVPAVLGGDHSVTYPVLHGVRQICPEISVVWLDAHPDIYTEYEGDPHSYACPLARILDDGGIAEVHQGGIRASSRELNDRLDSAGVYVYPAAGIDRMYGLALGGPVYLTVNIDVLDPTFAPDVGNPVPGGLSTRQLVDLIHSFDFHIVGFDVVKVNPVFDHAQITAAAAKAFMEIIGHISARSAHA